jgi:hypothetical protein
MKYMTLFMALMFFKVPCGLCLYFIASTLWGIGERLLLPTTLPATAAAPSRAPLPTAGRGADTAAERPGLFDSIRHAFDSAVDKHGHSMYGALYGFHALRTWLNCIGKQQVVMGPMSAALAKQNILPSRQGGTWHWVSGVPGVQVNMLAHTSWSASISSRTNL